MRRFTLLVVGLLGTACAHHDVTPDATMPSPAPANASTATYTADDSTQPTTPVSSTPDGSSTGSTPGSTGPAAGGGAASQPGGHPGGAADSSSAAANPGVSGTAPQGGGVSPDNTGVNRRDNGSGNFTPIDQGNSPADVKMVAAIRRAVVGDKSLSFTAKNVKIITKGGMVVLRGPVKTTQERDEIETKARSVAGVTNVDNQLEVKP